MIEYCHRVSTTAGTQPLKKGSLASPSESLLKIHVAKFPTGGNSCLPATQHHLHFSVISMQESCSFLNHLFKTYVLRNRKVARGRKSTGIFINQQEYWALCEHQPTLPTGTRSLANLLGRCKVPIKFRSQYPDLTSREAVSQPRTSHEAYLWPHFCGSVQLHWSFQSYVVLQYH